MELGMNRARISALTGFLLAIAVVMLVVACGGESAPEATAVTEESTAAPTETAPVGTVGRRGRPKPPAAAARRAIPPGWYISTLTRPPLILT